MRKIQLLFAALVLLYPALAQDDAEKVIHDRATDLIAEALFDGQSKTVRERQRAFENANGIKLHFTVDDGSLDQLGGLSEHLFRLFKTIVTPFNVQAKTITGEFSLMDANVLSDIVQYRTNATSDVRNCHLPLKESQRLDTVYSRGLAKLPALAGSELVAAPENINDLLSQAALDYERIIRSQPACDQLSNTIYDQCVKNTRGNRSVAWQNDAQAIGVNLSANLGLVTSQHPGGGIQNNGSTGINLNIDHNTFSGAHVINLNNSVNECTRRDMETRCRILHKKTNIRYFFLTKTLNYFLPRDSTTLFRDLATSTFSADLTTDLIVALYLKMTDPTTGQSGTALLVKQINGEWLSAGDIAYATYNNGGDYQGNTMYRFNNLYKNIPKPLIVCYQVAKVNGLFTTVYLQKATAAKGHGQIYNHVFKIDRAFDEVAQYDSQIDALYGASSGGLGVNQELFEKIAELRTRQKLAYIRASVQPEFRDAGVQFREAYLQDKQLAEAAALKHVQIEYGQLYNNNKFDELIANRPIPADINAGSCLTPDNSDVIGDALNIASLLLSPSGLDFIPDALATLYFASTDQTLDAFMSSISFFVPGNLCGVKTIVQDGSEAIANANRGCRLLTNGISVEAVDPCLSYLATTFRLEQEVSAALVSKANSNLVITRKLTGQDDPDLLPVTAAQAQVWKNTEKLPPKKRVDLVNKCYDDDAFRNKCFADPDEVLRWGGYFLENIPDEKTIEDLSKTIQNLPGPQLPPKIAFTFNNSLYTNRRLTSNETYFKYHGRDNRTGKKYAWFTNKKYSTENELREKLAIRSDWGVEIESVTEFNVPAETWISEGQAAAQGPGYPGGDYQAVILNVPKAWIIRTENAWN